MVTKNWLVTRRTLFPCAYGAQDCTHMWSDLLLMSYDDFKVSDDEAHLLRAQVKAFKDYLVTEMTKIDAERSDSAVHLVVTMIIII